MYGKRNERTKGNREKLSHIQLIMQDLGIKRDDNLLGGGSRIKLFSSFLF